MLSRTMRRDMTHLAVVAGSLCCALAVAAGAFGAHGLADRLDPRGLELWETAARYLTYAGLGLLATGVLDLSWQSRPLAVAAWALALGALVFSGTLFALALGGPRWLGAVTPLGGLGLIVGFLAIAWAAIGR